MESIEISLGSLIISLIILIIPLTIAHFIKLKIFKVVLISMFRMFVQLFLVGIFLKYLFELNNIFLNIIWLLFMVVIASWSVISRSRLKIKYFILAVFSGIFITIIFVLIFFNKYIIGLKNIFEIKFIIAMGGMVLGNCLKGNVISLSKFYTDIRENEKKFLYNISLGATRLEVLVPYMRKSLLAAINPTIISIANVGLISLPGMMTGQILGGSLPLKAIKYQILIMIAIFFSIFVSSFLILIFSMNNSFSKFDVLDKKIFCKT